MKSELRSGIFTILEELVKNTRALAPVYQTTKYYTRKHFGGWLSESMFVPDYSRIYYQVLDQNILPRYSGIIDEFYTEYSTLNGMVGIGDFGRKNLGIMKEEIIMDLFLFLVEHYDTNYITIEEINDIIDKFERFCDTGEVNLSIQGELNGFSCMNDVLILSPTIKIRKFTEKEISSHKSEPYQYSNFINEFCIEFDELGVITNEEMNYPSEFSHEKFSRKIEEVISILNIYKGGGANLSSLRIVPKSFCISGLFGSSHPFQEKPFGSLSFSQEDIMSFPEFYNQCKTATLELEIGISRLFYAENRLKPIDAIIDAVIGLESLLLTGEKSETTFKFSFRYALFFDKELRKIKYEHAKIIYDIRSRVVHGDLRQNDLYKLEDGIARNLNDISTIIKDDLRFVLKQIIQRGWETKIKKKGFWEDEYFK